MRGGLPARRAGNHLAVARVETSTTATPQDVWDVLMDPEAYGHWVVGSSHIRDVDSDWPAVGSRFHHTVGVGPLKLRDHTEVLEVEPPRRLVLKAKARPLGTARVELEIRRAGAGAGITMVEGPGDALSRPVLGNPVSDRLIALRNRESLRRLRRLAEERAFRREAAGAAAA
jgi:uncharacterized protein YndB with AHSA1/START domain